MQFILFLIVFIGIIFYLGQEQNQYQKNLRSVEPLYKEFQNWMAKHGQIKNEDLALRFQIYKKNQQIVEQSNQEFAQQGKSLRLGLGKFAAITQEEFAAYFSTEFPPYQQKFNKFDEQKALQIKDIPQNIDWGKKGAVTPVEYQGFCGSCWAFGTKEGLEGTYQISTGNLVVLSAQQLVDCVSFLGLNFGCVRGDPYIAYSYVSNHGIESNDDYPYISGITDEKGNCNYNSDKVIFKNSGQVIIFPQNDYFPIQTAVSERPVTVILDASSTVFQLYESGIITSENCGTTLTHVVLITGYNTTSSTPYWTIKNTFGEQWGQQGYANIEMSNANDGLGVCGINQYATYPKF